MPAACKCEVFFALNVPPHYEGVIKSEDIDLIDNLGSTLRWVSSFTIRPPSAEEIAFGTPYIEDCVLNQCESGICDEDKNLLPLSDMGQCGSVVD
jgi:hypothetical protein